MEKLQPIDDRAESFLQVGDVAYYIAKEHADVAVDETTHERWRQLMALLREFDTLVDDTAVSEDEALSRLYSFQEFEERYGELSPSALGTDAFEQLFSRTKRVLKLGHFIADAQTTKRFVALRANEGRQTARLLEDSATEEVKNQPNFQKSFLPTMESLSMTACTLDSITDARRDYADGKIRLAPNKEYYQQLAGASFAHAKLGMQALLHAPVMKQFAIMSATRLRNRFTHGVTDSSSLHNFR